MQVAHNPPWSGVVGAPTLALLGPQHPIPHEILCVVEAVRGAAVVAARAREGNN